VAARLSPNAGDHIGSPHMFLHTSVAAVTLTPWGAQDIAHATCNMSEPQTVEQLRTETDAWWRWRAGDKRGER
jgi:hypothetical protein